MEQLKNGTRQLRDGVMVTHLQSRDGASAIVADHGAHLLSWCPAGGAEALFLSRTSAYGGSAAIRGGVPVIFPQFGALGSGQRHGFARNTDWRYRGAAFDDGAAVASWELDSAATGVIEVADTTVVPGFRLTCDMRLAAGTIDIGLVWPTGKAPVVMALYFTQPGKDDKANSEILASAARVVVEAFKLA